MTDFYFTPMDESSKDSKARKVKLAPLKRLNTVDSVVSALQTSKASVQPGFTEHSDLKLMKRFERSRGSVKSQNDISVAVSGKMKKS